MKSPPPERYIPISHADSGLRTPQIKCRPRIPRLRTLQIECGPRIPGLRKSSADTGYLNPHSAIRKSSSDTGFPDSVLRKSNADTGVFPRTRQRVPDQGHRTFEFQTPKSRQSETTSENSTALVTCVSRDGRSRSTLLPSRHVMGIFQLTVHRLKPCSFILSPNGSTG